jgi:hypothetical protein
MVLSGTSSPDVNSLSETVEIRRRNRKMPTGYTAKIGDTDISFKDFALHCARAFGACIMQRDAPIDEPPKLQEVDNYHLKQVALAQEKLRALALMPIETARTRAEEEYAQTLKNAEEGSARDARLKERYEAMLVHVDAWQPPTPDHQGLKDFMAQQLKESISFDCGSTYWQEVKAGLKCLTAEEWVLKEKAQLAKDLDYHTKNLAEEEERTKGRNAWITALKDSLSTTVVRQ